LACQSVETGEAPWLTKKRLRTKKSRVIAPILEDPKDKKLTYLLADPGTGVLKLTELEASLVSQQKNQLSMCD
jgi:hypothetical protein